MLEGRRGFSAFNVAEAESCGKCPYQSREDSESQLSDQCKAAMLEGRRGVWPLTFRVPREMSLPVPRKSSQLRAGEASLVQTRNTHV